MDNPRLCAINPITDPKEPLELKNITFYQGIASCWLIDSLCCINAQGSKTLKIYLQLTNSFDGINPFESLFLDLSVGTLPIYLVSSGGSSLCHQTRLTNSTLSVQFSFCDKFCIKAVIF